MANFDVTLSALTQAASNIRQQTAEFKEQSQKTYQAAQTLSEGWEGDSYQEFIDNMEQLHSWMDKMAETLDTYSAALDKAKDTYETADVESAKNFG